MKVLFISSGNSNEGISPIIKSQGKSLIRENIELDFFTIKGKGVKGYLKNISLLKIHLKQKKYDILHAHFGLSGIIGFLSRKNEKIIVSFMGDDLVGSHDFNGNYTAKSKIFILINKFFAKYFYHFSIVKSMEMFKILNISNSKIIPNGVNFTLFYEIKRDIARSSLNEKKDYYQVLFCSNPDRSEKNFRLAKSAVEYLSDDKIRLKYIHGIKQENLVKYYNSADCLLLTSFHEGSPNVIKEAMACNIPIVSTNVGDVREVIENTEGCFITSFKKEDVADKIKKALEFGKRTTGREDIKYLESSIVAKRIIELYKKVLKN